MATATGALGKTRDLLTVAQSALLDWPGPLTGGRATQQYISPISKGDNGKFLKNESEYSSSVAYPLVNKGNLNTSYMNGYAIALCTFTPMIYYPSFQKAGYYSVEWNGSSLSSGIYFYQMKAGDFVAVKKMMMIK